MGWWRFGLRSRFEALLSDFLCIFKAFLTPHISSLLWTSSGCSWCLYCGQSTLSFVYFFPFAIPMLCHISSCDPVISWETFLKLPLLILAGHPSHIQMAWRVLIHNLGVGLATSRNLSLPVNALNAYEHGLPYHLVVH